MSLLKRWLSRDSKPAPSSTSKASPPQGSDEKKQEAAAQDPATQSRPGKAVKNVKGSSDQAKVTAPKKNKPLTKDLPPLGNDFEVLDLPKPLNYAIQTLGFETCTPVQKSVLPHSLDGADIIAQAQTGTGKTAAFLVSLITFHLENPEERSRAPGVPFGLIIAPTRELVMQIAADAEALTRFTDLRVMAVVGGIDYEKQKKQLTTPVDIVVATPGRLLDFCRSDVLKLNQVEMLVIDEADRMLNMGFIPDVKAIIQRCPRKERRQTQLFSATFSEDIKRLAARWTLEPVRIEIAPEKVATDTVTQKLFLTAENDKFSVLCNLIDSEDLDKVIIFVNRRDATRRLEDRLYRQGYATGLLTGEVTQKKRVKTLEDFKSGELKVLVATDVAGRGIHVDNITHVVNYNLPEDPEDYVHRIGRTGRAGADGTSISLICENDAFMLGSIETLLGQPLVCEHPPEHLLQATKAPIRGSRKQDLIQQGNDSKHGRRGKPPTHRRR